MRERNEISSRASSFAMSVPWKTISPESGVSRRVTHRATVDFPDPDSPTSASVWPVIISKSTLSTAFITTRFCHNPPRAYFLLSLLTRSRLCIAAPPLEFVDNLLLILKTIHRSRRLWHELKWILPRADVHAFGATRLEPATHRQTRWIGRFAFDGRHSAFHHCTCNHR